MEKILVWTLVYWNAPEMIPPKADTTVVHASTGYFRTEDECWEGGRGLKFYPTMRLSCVKTMMTKAELDLVDERSTRSDQWLKDFAGKLNRAQEQSPRP